MVAVLVVLKMETDFVHFSSRWRVLEISDIIMIIVDIRHPVIHFPPSLYQYVVNDMKRKLVVVFNKVRTPDETAKRIRMKPFRVYSRAHHHYAIMS